MFPKKILTLLIFLLISFSNIHIFLLHQIFLFNQQLIGQQKHLVETSSKEERIEKLKEIARDTVDIKGLGFYSVGTYRRTLSEKQLKEYVKSI